MLSQALTSELYGAAFDSAALAYYEAYLDGALSLRLWAHADHGARVRVGSPQQGASLA